LKAVIVVSDLHIGSLTGLVAPKAKLDGGGEYSPSKFQKALWKFWCDFWYSFVPYHTTKAASTTVVLNGDLIEGAHHNTVGIWTNDTDCQAANAVSLLEPLRKVGQIFVVRGTESHSGPGSKSEEAIARALGCTPNEAGEYATWQLWMDVDGVVIQFAHHISTTSSAAYETSAPMREMITGLVEAAQWGQKLPSVFVRSHRHRFVCVPMATAHGRVQAVITPGWQLKTPFVERVDRMRVPHIGGIVMLIEDEKCQIQEKLYPLPGPKPILI